MIVASFGLYIEHGAKSENMIQSCRLARFADQHLLGHDRAAMLEVQLPAGTAKLAAQRDRQAAALYKQLAKIETGSGPDRGSGTQVRLGSPAGRLSYRADGRAALATAILVT
jgi:hypothetical protein